MKIRNLDAEQLETAANMLKAMAHPVRIQILSILEEKNRQNVTQIHEELGIEQSSVSHHLGILRDKGVLKMERKGKHAYYYLKHETLSRIIDCISKCAIK